MSCTLQSQAYNIAMRMRRSLRFSWDLSSCVISGVSLQEVAAVNVNASKQKLDPGGKAPGEEW